MAELIANIEWGTIFFQLATFIVLFLLLRRFAFGPLIGVLHKRQQHVEEQLQSAETQRQDAEGYLKEQKEELEKARKEAQEMMERAKKQSQTEAEDIVRTAQQKADRLLEEAKKDIEREKDKAVAELREEVGGLSVMLASKIMDKEIDKTDQAQEIDQFMKQVGDRL